MPNYLRLEQSCGAIDAFLPVSCKILLIQLEFWPSAPLLSSASINCIDKPQIGDDEDDKQLVERLLSTWFSSRGERPAHTPQYLRPLEAELLDERILLTCENTLLLDQHAFDEIRAHQEVSPGSNVVLGAADNRIQSDIIVSFVADVGLEIYVDGRVCLAEEVRTPELLIDASELIRVESDSIISTRKVATGQDPFDATSIDHSGSVSLRSQEIQVAENSAILAHANGQFNAGNVDLIATAIPELERWSFATDDYAQTKSLSDITLANDAIIRGNNVKIQVVGSLSAGEEPLGPSRFGKLDSKRLLLARQSDNSMVDEASYRPRRAWSFCHPEYESLRQSRGIRS